MKFIHLSDIHIGKRVNGFSMIEDQDYILNQILEIAKKHEPDAALIAGDIYDKSVPSAEAVQLFDKFLVELARLGIKTFVISGNHDSAERIAFGGKLMESDGVYMSPVYNGDIKPVTLTDQYGSICIYMLPFIKPSHVRAALAKEDISSYTDAVKAAIEKMGIDASVRNILITHQFVTGASRCDSEDISVGGTDNVDVSIFEPFDYIALGHIHGPQNVGNEKVRYCGTPLKYSFSECHHKKSVTIVTLNEKNSLSITEIPLVPLRDMQEIYGSYYDITEPEYYKNIPRDNYLHITLTDENDIPDALSELRKIYPNIMVLDYDNTRTKTQFNFTAADTIGKSDPAELFSDFYKMCNGADLDDEQYKLIRELIKEVWEEDV